MDALPTDLLALLLSHHLEPPRPAGRKWFELQQLAAWFELQQLAAVSRTWQSLILEDPLLNRLATLLELAEAEAESLEASPEYGRVKIVRLLARAQPIQPPDHHHAQRMCSLVRAVFSYIDDAPEDCSCSLLLHHGVPDDLFLWDTMDRVGWLCGRFHGLFDYVFHEALKDMAYELVRKEMLRGDKACPFTWHLVDCCVAQLPGPAARRLGAAALGDGKWAFSWSHDDDCPELHYWQSHLWMGNEWREYGSLFCSQQEWCEVSLKALSKSSTMLVIACGA